MPNPIRIEDMFYLRVRVPADVLKKVRGTQINVPIADSLKTVVVREAVKVSLQTRDAQEARRRFVTALAFVEAHWDAVRNGPQPLTHKASLAIAGELRQLWIGILDDDPGTPEIWRQIIEADKQAAEGVVHPLAIPTSKTKQEALEGRYGAVTDAFLRSKGILVDNGSRGRLLEHVATAMAEMADVNLRKAGGDYSETGQTNKYPPLEDLSLAQSIKASAKSEALELTFKEVIDQRMEEKSSGQDAVAMPEATTRKYRTATGEFATHRGSCELATVTAREADAWKRSMLAEGRLANKTIGQRLQNVRTVVECLPFYLSPTAR